MRPIIFMFSGQRSQHSRYHRLHTQASRVQYAVARALLKTTLARYAGMTERDWHFEADAFSINDTSNTRRTPWTKISQT
jgi:hypothetical protein